MKRLSYRPRAIIVILLVSLFLAFAILQTYAATSHYIEVMTIRANLFPGDTLRLYAGAANNSGQDIYGDVFLGFIAPGGEIYFFDPSLNLLQVNKHFYIYGANRSRVSQYFNHTLFPTSRYHIGHKV